MIIIVPSRGRARGAAEMVQSVHRTAAGPVRVVVAVDPDDPALPDYRRKVRELVVMPARIGYSASLNAIARDVWDDEDILGAFGDDVRFRTFGWDERVRSALATPGIAYGNDLVHAAGHPTAIWMSSVIARSLGWLALPTSWHLWVDDAWKRLGQETGTLRYLPDLIVEHMHPVVGKAKMDRTYEEVYDGDRGHRDHLAFMDWERSQLASDAALVRAVI